MPYPVNDFYFKLTYPAEAENEFNERIERIRANYLASKIVRKKKEAELTQEELHKIEEKKNENAYKKAISSYRKEAKENKKQKLIEDYYLELESKHEQRTDT